MTGHMNINIWEGVRRWYKSIERSQGWGYGILLRRIASTKGIWKRISEASIVLNLASKIAEISVEKSTGGKEFERP